MTRDAPASSCWTSCAASNGSDLRTLFESTSWPFSPKPAIRRNAGAHWRTRASRRKLERRRVLEERVYNGVDGIVCTSEGARRMLDEHFALHARPVWCRTGRASVGEYGEPHVQALLDDSRATWMWSTWDSCTAEGVDGLLRAMALLPGARLTWWPARARGCAALESLATELGIVDRVASKARSLRTGWRNT